MYPYKQFYFLQRIFKNKKLMMAWLTVFFFVGIPSIGNAFFCPTNFNQIDYGYTTDQVIQQCGKPDKEEKSTKKAEAAQEWSYFVPQTVTDASVYTTQGTMKTEISFDNSGKVINISVNGIAVGATTVCNGSNLQLGATREQVKQMCDDPTYVNKDANPETLPPEAKIETKVTTFIYSKANPPVKLIFENGLLKAQE